MRVNVTPWPEPMSSRIPGFYDLPLDERRSRALAMAGMAASAAAIFEGSEGLRPEQADHMIENVIGVYALPLGVAVNFQVNGIDYLIPMAIEEPSVVAGASYMARLAREAGGFRASAPAPVMIGQVQLLDVPDPIGAQQAVLDHQDEITRLVDEVDPVIQRLGGGARGVEARLLPETPLGPMLIVHLHYDTRDAMGANAVNTAVERLAPLRERLTQLCATYLLHRADAGEPAQDPVARFHLNNGAKLERLKFEAFGTEANMALGDGHQAITEPAYGTYKFDKSTGTATIVNVVRFPAECVNPPEGVKSDEWVKGGMKGAKCK